MFRKQGKPKLIPAVGYLRKSTRGKRTGGREKQEKSIPQQRAEVIKLARNRFEIVAWFIDEGISGWKREAKRPDFQKMLQEVSKLGAQAVLCDHIDRFSRATVREVQIDTNELVKAGVRWILTCNHGEFDLGRDHDLGEIMKFIAAVWAAHEYSRQLSRRVTLARRNAAMQGKRTGGPVPYGLVDDGQGGLRIGDAKKIKNVKWLFTEFVNHQRSLLSLANELNEQKVPGPRGGSWFVPSVKCLLTQASYKGDFLFNRNGKGQFYRIDGQGEVVEAGDCDGGKLYSQAGCYRHIITPALFAKAQRRLATLSEDRSRRKRVGYALTGVLFCGHCDAPMYGVRRGKQIVYRCSTPAKKGSKQCGHYQVRESIILPFILRLLGKELVTVRELLSTPPEHLREPQKQRAAQCKQAQKEREQLAAQIGIATRNLMLCTDARSRQAMDQELSAMRDELERVEAEATGGHTVAQVYNHEDLDALKQWWDDFSSRAVSVPVPASKIPAEPFSVEHFFQDPEAEESALLLDPRVVNGALLELGTEVRLYWETQSYTTGAGNPGTRHVLTRGRFRLGQQLGKVPQAVLASSATRTSQNLLITLARVDVVFTGAAVA